MISFHRLETSGRLDGVESFSYFSGQVNISRHLKLALHVARLAAKANASLVSATAAGIFVARLFVIASQCRIGLV